MGLIRAAANIIGVVGSCISSEVADQYLEFFTCDSLGQDVLVRKGAAQIQKGKNKGNAEVITNGSHIAVPEKTALLLVDNGKIIDFTTEPGMYTWDSSSSPSVLTDSHLLTNAKNVVKDTWERMRHGGEIAKQQRVYFVNMMEMRDNKFGTATPLAYNDPEYRNIYIRLNGSFSFHVEDPVAFFRCVGNIAGEFTITDLMGKPSDPKQPRTEFLDNFSEVLNKCGGQDKIMFSNLPSEQGRLRKYMQEALDEEWLQNRGMLVDTVAIGTITPDDTSRARIEQVDQAKMFGQDGAALAAQQVLGTTQALNTAAGNSAGAVNGMMGMGMIGGMQGGFGGGNAAAFQFLGQQQAQQQAQQAAAPVAPVAAAPAAAPEAAGWTCPKCGANNIGKFCAECGTAQPAPAPAAGGWTCPKCGTSNTGKFCAECGTAQPAAAPTSCPKCGYTPADGKLGKFCPECGNKIE